MKVKIYFFLCVFGLQSVVRAQIPSKYIIVDQFGYLPKSQKIAIIKDPVIGFDADESFSPGQTYIVVNAITGEQKLSGSPVSWNQGNTDSSSGDKVWHFNFSSVTETGRYFILDAENHVRSFEFEISPIVYKEVLKSAVRSFFYQRAGFFKDAQYAGAAWSDGASHVGLLQDKNCRLFSDKNNPSTEYDLSGGWYDAGDYNKYTNWTANYVVEMMKAYLEKPDAWGDDYNIPESGNGIPDLLDEAKWGIDFLLRMQRQDGSVLCIVSESHASPPSGATGQSLYGPSTTSATFNSAAAFATGAKVYRAIHMTSYADTLLVRARKAWDWAVMNPGVIFNNNSAENSSLGVGAGNQEEDEYGRAMSQLEAACFLFDQTNEPGYREYFDSHYQNAHLITWHFAYPYEPAVQDLLLYYTQIPGADPTVSGEIKNFYRNAMAENADNFPAYYTIKDPYRAHLSAYTWGSNAQKGAQGTMYYNLVHFGLDPAGKEDARDAALGYINYLHGANPLNMVYLSNMYKYGGDNCVNEFYHSWFCDGSAKWDRVGKSLYGPAPGYLTGGPNPSYDWSDCCPNGCGSAGNNAACVAESISPPKDQPKQKSYKDFNTSWPLNSWEITENSCGYQVNYIRLLSKFVTVNLDCHGDSAGTASFDECGICSGGDTGIMPVTDPCQCPGFNRSVTIHPVSCDPYPSPSGRYTWTASGEYYDTIPSESGCDSVITVNLTIPEVNTDVSMNEGSLLAEISGAGYRWLLCDDNYRFIENETAQSFTPLSTGQYAVEVSHHECVDTSDCYLVSITGLLVNALGEGLEIYPNPATGSFTLSLPEIYDVVSLELSNLQGHCVWHQEFFKKELLYLSLHEPAGLYLLTIRNNLNKIAVVKVVIR